MIAISACLVGISCRYDSNVKADEKCMQMLISREAIPVCPEQLGGLPTPRAACEIIGGDGSDVLCGKAKVIDKNGIDRSENFIEGAKSVLYLCKKMRIEKVILKSKSPSCGCGYIYDGSFNNILTAGDGVTTALLKQNSITIESI